MHIATHMNEHFETITHPSFNNYKTTQYSVNGTQGYDPMNGTNTEGKIFSITDLDAADNDTVIFEYVSDYGPLWGIWMSFLSIFTICGNGVLIFIIFKTSLLRTTTNGFIVSLAISDLIMGVFFMPFSAATSFLEKWPYGKFYCSVTGFIFITCSSATILNLMAVTLDRGLAVSLPLKYHVVMSPPLTCMIIIIVWLESIIFGLLPMSDITVYEFIPERYTCLVSFPHSKHFFITQQICCIFIPSIVIAVLFFIILRAAREQKRVFAVMPLPVGLTLAINNNSTGVNYRRTTLKAMRTLFLIVAILTFLWLPHTIIQFMQMLQQKEINPNTVTFTFWLSLMSSAINPIIFLSNKKFKQRFKELIFYQVCKGYQLNDDSASTTARTPSTNLSIVSSISKDGPSTGSRQSVVRVLPKPVPVIDVKANTLQVPQMVIPRRTSYPVDQRPPSCSRQGELKASQPRLSLI